MPQSDYNHVYYKLQDYMLTSKNMTKFAKLIIENKDVQKPVKITKKDNSIFFPSQKDQLFWCFYISLYGKMEYEMNLNKTFSIEKDFKISTIEDLRKNPILLKTNKLRRNEIEDELLNHKQITMKGLFALCLYYNVNIFYINNQKYYEIITCSDKPTHLIEYKNKEYGLHQNITEDKLSYYRNNFWLLENLSKPLKAASTYKISDLVDICKRLEIGIYKDGKKKQKKELYENILSKL